VEQQYATGDYVLQQYRPPKQKRKNKIGEHYVGIVRGEGQLPGPDHGREIQCMRLYDNHLG
jgi:hypothetical protein